LRDIKITSVIHDYGQVRSYPLILDGYVIDVL